MSERPITSASNLFRRRSCPGSEQAERNAPPQPEDSKESAEGTMLHAVLLSGCETPEPMTSEQETALEWGMQAITDAWVNIDGGAVISRRTEVDLEVRKRLRLLITGHADLVIEGSGADLLVDLKFGRLPVQSAAKNDQLLTYAAGWLQERPESGKPLFLAIIQPRIHAVTLAQIPACNLAEAVDEIAAVLDACRAPDAPLVPSEAACRYCLAAGTCQAAWRDVEQTESLAILPEPDGGITVSDADMERIFFASKRAKKIIDRIEGEMKRRLAENPEAFGGRVRLITPKPREAVADVAGVYRKLNEFGPVAGERFAQFVTITKKNLEILAREVTGRKGKGLAEAVADVLAGNTTSKQGARKLIVAGDEEEEQETE
jgi:hypothetical protein